MTGGLTGWVRRGAGRWLARRHPREGEVVLSQRRIYILPTGAGMAYGGLLLVLLIGSINYNLGLGFLLTFTAASCAVVDMVLTWRNLAHLQLTSGRVQPVFAGEQAVFDLQVVNRGKRPRYAVWIEAADAPASHAFDVPASGAATVHASAAARTRGWLPAPRVVLSTRFPLGLFRAWSYWLPDARALVYPAPEPDAPPLPAGGGYGGRSEGPSGEKDFAGVRGYQAGDPMRQLAWRQIARLDPELGGQLVTKQFDSGGGGDELLLDFGALPAQLDPELRLSRMTSWVLEAERRARPYAFRLGDQVFEAALGPEHSADCLRALALFEGSP